jgi:hypothetical protein
MTDGVPWYVYAGVGTLDTAGLVLPYGVMCGVGLAEWYNDPHELEKYMDEHSWWYDFGPNPYLPTDPEEPYRVYTGDPGLPWIDVYPVSWYPYGRPLVLNH